MCSIEDRSMSEGVKCIMEEIHLNNFHEWMRYMYVSILSLLHIFLTTCPVREVNFQKHEEKKLA